MKVLTLFSFAGIVLFFGCCLLSRSASAQNVPTPPTSSVVHVQQLVMPPKAVRRPYEKGSTLLFKHEYYASLAHFQEAIKLAPNFFPPYHNLALAQYNLGQFDDAAQNFEKAIALSKGSFAPSFFGLAIISYRRAQYAEAQNLVQQGLLADPGSAIGKYCLGLTQYSLGKTTDAQRSALEALRIDPHIADAYLLLAHVHERLDDPHAVVADVESYLKHTSNNELRSDALVLLERAQRDLARASFN
jgi:tetratricopeptide (TPR) repeat protein